MSYTPKQFEKTKQYIHEFFYSRSDKNHYLTFMQEFTKHLDSTFRQIDIFQPEYFKFSKDSVFMPGFAEWISKNIEPFPEDFSVVLTKTGDSYRECEGNKTMIFRAPLPLTKKQKKFSFEDLEFDKPFIPYNYNVKEDPYSFYTPIASNAVIPKAKSTENISTTSTIYSNSSSDDDSAYFSAKNSDANHEMFFDLEIDDLPYGPKQVPCKI